MKLNIKISYLIDNKLSTQVNSKFILLSSQQYIGYDWPN